MATVSFTEISAWKTCRRKWWWRYDQLIEPKNLAPQITMGTLCHIGMAACLKHEDHEKAIVAKVELELAKFPDMFDEERDVLLQQSDLAVHVVERAVTGGPWASNLENARHTERMFDVAIPKCKHHVMGVFDTFLSDYYGWWLTEWKFPKVFRQEDDTELSTQLAIYQWAAPLMGFKPVVGILYCQILPKLPQVPEQNKNGSTSRREIYTDWQTYAATVKLRGESPESYEEEMKPKLAEKDFWRMFRIYRTPEQVAGFVPELRATACDIATKKKRIYPCENSIHCGGCMYRELCLEMARGRDPSNVIEQSFRVRSEHAQESSQEDTDAITI